ncbi:MAG: T9SS type A sorting domain-containing protein [Crocinitomicaceae bacterium]|nr:T9SS type A sorting domain-containing protein [Crocinitomicaceae bacterium]
MTENANSTQIQIYNELGQNISPQFEFSKASSGQIRINCEQVSKGMYYICVTNDSGISTTKSVLIQ